jgi:hypothetical protein
LVTAVQLWSGREVRALRESKRMSIRTFAANLGVSERMVSKWEAGRQKIHPRPINQSALDSCLAASSADVQARFAYLIGVAGLAGSGLHEAMGELPVTSRTISLPTDTGNEHQVRHPIDGKLMTLVGAGVFLCGPNREPVWLPAFYIDVFPTTNADYARFTAATGWQVPQHWNKEGGPPDTILDHPVVFVTWHDANAYASWAAKTLPTGQQWEKAARGTRGDAYPWGSQLTPAKCNVRESGGRNTTPVSRYHSGVSPYGVYDMCGNTWEWCSTESDTGRYELKGSAFTSPFFRATPSTFNDASADMLDDDTGFRCVAPIDTMCALLTLDS